MGLSAALFAADVRRQASLPSALATGTQDADLYAHGDRALLGTLVPLLRALREEYYTRVFEIAVTAGTAAYRLPSRAVGCAARTAEFVDSSGTASRLSRLEPERAVEFQPVSSTRGTPWAFFLEGSRLVLVVNPAGNGTLRLRCQVRPGSLVASGAAITAVTPSGSSYVLSASGTWSTSSAVDIVASTSPSEHLACDAFPSAGGSGTLTVAQSAFSSPPVVGDYVQSTPGQSCLVQLPPEAYPLLVAQAAAGCVRSLGRIEQARDLDDECSRLKKELAASLAPRVEGSARKIVGGTLQQRRHWR